jgi:dipeptidyl aminopeptidase/acylaminoacyl peptidase
VLEDILDAADWAVREKVADPRRIALMGSSFGGYLTLLALAKHPDRFACGVDRAGPSSMTRFVTELAATPDGAEYARRRIMDASTPEGRRRLEEWSPLNLLDRMRRPVLILQGGKESETQRNEKRLVTRRLLDQGVPATYIEFPGEGHTFFNRSTRLAHYALVEAFLAQHLGGRCEPFDASITPTFDACLGEAHVNGLRELLMRPSRVGR